MQRRGCCLRGLGRLICWMTRAAANRSAMTLDEALRGVSFAGYFSRSQALLEELHPSVVSGQISFDEARNRRYELLAREFGGDRSLAITQAQAHVATYRHNERAVPGAWELLTALRRAGYPLFIVSNNTRAEQEGKLARLGLDHFFEALIVAGDLTRDCFKSHWKGRK